jgi:hypothetical protein
MGYYLIIYPALQDVLYVKTPPKTPKIVFG